ncbi:PT domain-containing protein (plasmid) [Streptomyces sp. NBC_00464]|uniref:PT domain-containing protein n=1 Tax=Streptomyces sp. NBC_00464 TaxID=2975751 RepID=UPI002E19D588
MTFPYGISKPLCIDAERDGAPHSLDFNFHGHFHYYLQFNLKLHCNFTTVVLRSLARNQPGEIDRKGPQMTVRAHPMPVAKALATGAPQNLGALAATAETARVVPVAECIARAESEAARLDVIARERNAWAADMRALFVDVHAGCNVLGIDVADARDWSDNAASVAVSAAKDAARARWEAERWTRHAERSASDMKAMRARTARLFSGEGDVRSRWVSTDGRTVVALALPTEADMVTESDTRFAELLSSAVAAKDAGRPLKSTDVPSKAKHGRGPGTEFKQAVARASRPLVQPWKAPRIPAEGKPLDGAALAILDADGVCAEVEAAPGVWLPRAAVCLVETASANGWTIAMERHGSGVVVVRAAGVLARTAGSVAGEIVAVWTAGMYDAHQSGAFVAGTRLDGAAELSRVLTTIGQSAEAGAIATADAPAGASAPAPAGVSAPSSVEGWEGDGNAALGVEDPHPVALPPRLAEDGAREVGAVRRALSRAEEAEAGPEAEASEPASAPARGEGERKRCSSPRGEEVSAAASADPHPLTCSERDQRFRPWQPVEQPAAQPVGQPAGQPVKPPAEQPWWNVTAYQAWARVCDCRQAASRDRTIRNLIGERAPRGAGPNRALDAGTLPVPQNSRATWTTWSRRAEHPHVLAGRRATSGVSSA